MNLFYSIVMGYPVGLLRDASKGTSTDLNISASLNVQNTIISGSNLSVNYAASSTAPTGATVASVKAWFQTANYGNIMLATNPEVGLTAPFNYLTPDFNPISATSLAAVGGGFTHPKLTSTFFTPVTYKGACAIGDTWWKSRIKYM